MVEARNELVTKRKHMKLSRWVVLKDNQGYFYGTNEKTEERNASVDDHMLAIEEGVQA